MKRALFFISLFLLISCEKESPLPEALGENGGIVGTWVENVDVSQAVVDDGVTRLSRSDDLDEHSYGFTILEDGTFIERKNAGWCGTPPIFYDNFSGTWTARSDSLLEITVGYWGGTMNYQIRIVSLDEQALLIRYLYAEGMADSK